MTEWQPIKNKMVVTLPNKTIGFGPENTYLLYQNGNLAIKDSDGSITIYGDYEKVDIK